MRTGTIGPRRAVGLMLSLLAGCAPTSKPEAPAAPEAPLRVAAASDLQEALPALVARFTKETGVEVTLTFGASGQLAEQIKAGAPFDVFFSANRAFVEDLAADSFVRRDSVRPYAVGSLVLALRGESADAVKSLADLTRASVRKVAIANPTFAPYGRAAKYALVRSNLWTAIEPKIVQAETVRQALQFVESGNAEAGLVGRASARAAKLRFVEIDPGLYDPIVQALGVVSRTKQSETAEAFTRFVLSDEGQGILVDFGFTRVGSGP